MTQVSAALLIAAVASTEAMACATPTSWTWVPIVAGAVTGVLALIGALGGTFVNGKLTRQREADARNQLKRDDFLYLAVTVSAILDAFVSRCAHVASDDGTHRGGPNPDGQLEMQTPAPTLSFDNLDVVWKSMPVDLLDELHSLPVRLSNAEAYLDFVAVYEDSGDGSDYFADRQLRYARIGVAAGELLSALRKRAGLRPQVDDDSTTMDWLRDQLSQYTKRDDEARRMRQKWQEEFAQQLGSSGTTTD